jgi:hypothetical protein
MNGTFHVSAFRSSLAASTLEQIDFLSDQVLTTYNNKAQLQRDADLDFAYGCGVDLLRAQLVQPSVRRISEPYITPVDNVASTPDQPAVCDYRGRPFRVKSLETLSFQGFQDNAGAQDGNVIVGLNFQRQSAYNGPIYTIRGTGSATLTAGVWNDVPITWEPNLEGGMYQVVGGYGISATGIAFRLIQQSQVLRPGGLVVGGSDEETHPMFRYGGLGKWLDFESDALPNIQWLADAADTSQTVYLDIIKIS